MLYICTKTKHTPYVPAALYTIAKTQDNLRVLWLTTGWGRWGTTCTLGYHSDMKKDEVSSFSDNMDELWEYRAKQSQTNKDKNHRTAAVCVIKQNKLIDTDNIMAVTRREAV